MCCFPFSPVLYNCVYCHSGSFSHPRGKPSVTPGNDPYDDEFSAPKPNLWDEEDGGNNKQ